ncbi:hypothetical protein HD554DRAFT_2037290 [Boletus coccyginus]|nr:hypothetical protein HD554DRAFT_2037290 [Boletus coccyginus]
MDTSSLAFYYLYRTNAIQNPGLLNLPIKKQIKVEKAKDDKHLKEVEAAKKKYTEDVVQCLATMEMEVEEKLATVEANKPEPVCPWPQPYCHTSQIVGEEGKYEQGPKVNYDKEGNGDSNGDVKISKTLKAQRKLILMKAAVDVYKVEYQKGTAFVKKQQDKHMFCYSDMMLMGLVITSKKFSKGGQLKKWTTSVTINANGSASPLITTATHTLFPTSSFGWTTMSSIVTSATTSTATLIHEPALLYTQKPMSYEIFTDEVGETEERAAALSWNKGEVNVSHQIDELEQALTNFDLFISDSEALGVGSQHPVSSYSTSDTGKCKAEILESTNVISNDQSEKDNSPAGNIMEIENRAGPIKTMVDDSRSRQCTMTLTSVGITISTGTPSPLKKVKLEALDPMIIASSNTSINSQTQKSGIYCNADGYITESIKPHNKYIMKDLPVW